MDVTLLVVASVFAVFNGVNDGSTLLVATLKMSSLRPLAATLVLVALLVVAPFLFGTQVATTFADRLVSFRGSDGQLALLLAVVSATMVVGILSLRGLPTSLTLALIGGILGVGMGAQLEIDWGWMLLALGLAAVAPFAGLLGAFAVSRIWSLLPTRGEMSRQIRVAHRFGFGLQAFAYGTNDGQKMLAVFALASPGVALDGGRLRGGILTMIGIGLLFAIGLLLGMRRYAARMGSGILPVTPINAATAQFASAGAVIGSAVLGAPVSMTQSITGGLVGSGMTEGGRRIRWHQASGILLAWALTLPIAATLSALFAFVFLHL